jgi:hypothetical protein
MPTDGPVHAGGCGVGPILRAGPSWWPQAPPGAWGVSCAGPRWRQRAWQGAAWRPRHREYGRGGGGGHCVLRQSMSASPVRRRGVLRGPVVAVGAAGSAVPQQRQARIKRASRCRAVVPGPVGLAPSAPVPGAASAAITHGPPAGAASGGPGGARVGAAVGHREVRAPASVPSTPTRACRRRRIASAPASLRLLAAPEAWR